MNVKTPRHAALALLALCLGPSLAAAPDRTAPAPGPDQAQAPVPGLAYRSALQAYRPWREQAPGNWRQLNDEVTRIGGWRSYLREVNQTPTLHAPSPSFTPPLAPALAPPAAAPAATPAATPVNGASATTAAPPTAAAKSTPKPPHHGHH